MSPDSLQWIHFPRLVLRDIQVEGIFTYRSLGWLPFVTGFLVFWIGGYGMAIAVEEIHLPPPSYEGKVTVEQALKARRTHRSFKVRPLSLKQLSQILWGAYGVTSTVSGCNMKTAPSAGALYPIDIYAVVGKGGVATLAPGVYHYSPERHSLTCTKGGDQRAALAQHALHQMWMAEAPVVIVITGDYVRCTGKYGRRGVTYTHIEAGHVGQNVFLQAEATGLKAGIVGAFENDRIIKALGISATHDPLSIMPVGFVD